MITQTYIQTASAIMPTNYSTIYLSPHLDDAALSCGAQIFQRIAAGERILIITVMAGSPAWAEQSAYIDSLHERWQLAGDAAAERRAEDIAACAILGADSLHLPIPDCIYRTDPANGASFYTSDDDIFGDIHPAEAGLVDEIARMLRDLPVAGQVVAPLGVGHHVDHLLVRAAAEQVWPAGLAYYEDYPYAEKPGYLQRMLGDDLRTWRPDVQEITPAGLAAKCDAIWAFRSQMSTFFDSREAMAARVGGYMEQVGGERLWVRVGSA
jgi:LmbE family N-acetylglucosaminyl deacetylase